MVYLVILVLILGSPLMVIRALLAWRNRRLMLRRFASIGIYFLAVVATISVFWLGDVRTKRNRQRVANAVEAYKKQRSGYPAQLEQLVPDFLPAIPIAMREGLFIAHPFYYAYPAVPGIPELTNEIPDLHYGTGGPFVRIWYDFKTRQWYQMD
ncbi:MAG TPA: hypothetical protein VFC44_09785 [Candidatus Saccharimonadales bacterium]|nr:hypothetical protein [Candidatus Saccharimonadales bacterium]